MVTLIYSSKVKTLNEKINVRVLRGKKFWFTDIDNDVILVKVISPQKSAPALSFLNYSSCFGPKKAYNQSLSNYSFCLYPTFSSDVVLWLGLRTHDTEVVSLYPASTYSSYHDKSTVCERGNERPPHRIHFPRKLRAISLVSPKKEIQYAKYRW